MNKHSILAASLVAAVVCAPAQSFLDVADASLDAIREGREQNAAPANVRAIFAKAKAAADEDDKLNLCGFYTGMSAADAQTLVGHYALKDGEWSIKGDPVYEIYLSLKGVRRVTKGGNTFDELAQAVANRVGSLKQDWETKDYSLKTIDGIVVKMSESSGFNMVDTIEKKKADDVRAAAERKAREERKAAERKAREERETAERKAREEREAARVRRVISSPEGKAAVESILASMVNIPGKDFKMGKTEVTQAQWEAIMGENPSRFKGENNPVEQVSWDDCQEFIQILNLIPTIKASGLTFRLPSSEEWKYACRAGASGYYCRLANGNEITEDTLGQVAWFAENSDRKTHPVGQKQPNAFGLYDMLGNVGEWGSDTYSDSRNRNEWGGNFKSRHSGCTCDWSWCNMSYVRFDSTGFRLCAEAVPKGKGQ